MKDTNTTTVTNATNIAMHTGPTMTTVMNDMSTTGDTTMIDMNITIKRHLLNEDKKEKQTLGELWAARSDGSCLFVMPTDKDYAAVERAISAPVGYR